MKVRMNIVTVWTPRRSRSRDLTSGNGFYADTGCLMLLWANVSCHERLCSLYWVWWCWFCCWWCFVADGRSAKHSSAWTHSRSTNKITFKDAEVGTGWIGSHGTQGGKEPSKSLEILRDKRRVEHIGSQSWRLLVRIKEAHSLGLGGIFQLSLSHAAWLRKCLLKLAWAVLLVCFYITFMDKVPYGRSTWWIDVCLCMRDVCECVHTCVVPSPMYAYVENRH